VTTARRTAARRRGDPVGARKLVRRNLQRHRPDARCPRREGDVHRAPGRISRNRRFDDFIGHTVHSPPGSRESPDAAGRCRAPRREAYQDRANGPATSIGGPIKASRLPYPGRAARMGRSLRPPMPPDAAADRGPRLRSARSSVRLTCADGHIWRHRVRSSPVRYRVHTPDPPPDGRAPY